MVMSGKTAWKLARYGGLLALIGAGLAFLFGAFHPPKIIFSTIPDVNVREQILSGVSPDVGNKLLSYLGGIIPTDSLVVGLIAVALSGAAIFLIGGFGLSLVKRNFPNPTWRGALIGVIGSAAVTAILTLFKISLVPFGITLVTLLLYYAILVFIANGLAKLFNVEMLKTPDVR